MATKNTVEVVIAGKVFRISGYETPEYLHQVSVYINEKLAQFQQLDGYRKQNTDQKQMMLNMNLADDFFKAKRQADKLSAELEKKDREMYGIRHDLIEAQMANEKLETEKKEWKAKLTAEKKELETRLNAEKRELEEALEAQKKELEARKQENTERLELKKQAADRERQELKRTIEAQERNLENQKKAMEAQRQSSHKKLEEQNQAAQKRLAEQKRSFEEEIVRLQRENRDLQRKLGQRSYT